MILQYNIFFCWSPGETKFSRKILFFFFLWKKINSMLILLRFHSIFSDFSVFLITSVNLLHYPLIDL